MEIYDEQFPYCCDILLVEEFLENIKSGFLDDSSGSARPAKGGKMSKRCILPSTADQIPKDATHIVWLWK